MPELAGFCSLCRSRCGTLNTVENGRLISVRPNPEHPTGQAMCPKGRAAPEIANHARRLTKPLRRTRPKGDADPGWVEIDWEEAMATIAARLGHYRDVYGPETVSFTITSQSSSSISDSTDWIQRLSRLYGTPNNCMAIDLCNWHKDFNHAYTLGVGMPTPDYRNSDLIVLWGHDPASSWLAQANAIGAARSRGARLVVIDPHRAGSTLDADDWLQVRPGTDGALALGIARLLIERAGFDADFAARWTNGPLLVRPDGHFLRARDLGWTEAANACVVANADGGLQAAANGEPGALRGSVTVESTDGRLTCRTAFDHYADACAPFTLARVAEITGIPAEQVERVADAFIAAGSVCYYGWTGIGQHTNAAQTDRAIAILHALTGSFDAPGGNVLFAKHPVRGINVPSLIPPEQRGKALGLDRLPLGQPAHGWVGARDLYTAILEGEPYRIRALVGFGSNIVVSHPDPLRARAALEALEFQVHCDLFLNPTAMYADIVLPVNSPWERESLRVGFEISQDAEELVQLRQKMTAPVGESRSDLDIVFELACRLGLSEQFFGGNIEAGWNHILAPIGLDVATLRQRPEGVRLPLEQVHRKYESQGFKTETGRLEIYSELFFRHGHPAVPDFKPPAEAPSASFPLILTTGNRGNFCHSQHRGIVALRRRAPEPELRLHPDTARARNLRAGDMVVLETRIGEAQLRLQVDERMHPDVAIADYGWWQACPELGLPGSAAGDPKGNSYNNVVGSDASDPISGGLGMRSFACEVRLAARGAWSGRRDVVVRRRRQLSGDVVAFEVAPADEAGLAGFRSGQHLRVGLGETARSYSLTGPAMPAPAVYEFAVKRLEGGSLSARLVDAVEVGDRLEIEAPSGLFALPVENEFPVVLMAAGIGITPFIGYLRTLTGAVGEPQVVLHYCVRDEKNRVFGDELDRRARELPNLAVVTHMTKPGPADRCDHRGRLTATVIDDALLARRARVYMCGPDEMMRALTAGLVARGMPAFEIFQERFQAARTAIPETGDAFDVRFARSGKTVRWTPAAGSILACAETAGVPVPSGCRVGSCESCAVEVLSGGAHHLVEIAGAEEGVCFTCQAVPTTNLVLDA